MWFNENISASVNDFIVYLVVMVYGGGQCRYDTPLIGPEMNFDFHLFLLRFLLDRSQKKAKRFDKKKKK